MNQSNKENSILNSRIIKIYYTATDAEGKETEYGMNVLLRGEQLQTVAGIMKEKNHGRPVDMYELGEVWLYIMDAAEDDYKKKYMKGGRIEDYKLCIDFDMPEELIYACQRINCMDNYLDVDFSPQEKDSELIDVEMEYSAEHNGQTVKESVKYSMRKDIAEIMKTAAQLKPLDVTDFGFMKEVAPKAYGYVYNDIKVWCNNKHLEEWKEVVEVELSDFPKDIFE